MIGVKNMTEEQIKDKLTKTCLCKQITRETIKEAIRNGADTLEKIKAQTGTMTGYCNGNRCKASIEGLLQQMKEQIED